MNIWDLLPMDPWNGPPLPRFLNILWPWSSTTTTTGSPLAKLFSNSQTALSAPAPRLEKTAAPAYENREEIEFPDGFDPDTFMPKKIVIHRKYRSRAQ